MADTGLPRKVLATAHTLGVHNDCLADPNGACASCTLSIHQAIDHHYGHLETSVDVIGELFADWLKENDA